jgi:fatty-acyl-CoA synthase
VTRRALPADEDGPAVEVVSCGPPIPGVSLRIVDDSGELLPDRHVGEIALRSDSMLTGYYRRDELTVAALRDGWVHTGDMGYLADGDLYITGRRKDLIIVGGKNIYPQDIEMLLNDAPGVHPGRVAVIGIANPTLGTEDVAVIVEVDDPALLDDPERGAEVQRAIRARIAQHTDVTARHVRLVPRMWLIKTSSGKIARAANRVKLLDLLHPPTET